MRSCVAVAFALILVLSGQSRAGDDGLYVKVEIKGRFDLGGPADGYKPIVEVGNQTYELDLTKLPGGKPAMKALRATEGEYVLVKGTLVVERGKRPRVTATLLTLEKE